MKFGKLYRMGRAWEKPLFDVTSWRLFKDVFIFPVREFAAVIREAPQVGAKREHRVYISRCLEEPQRWILRRAKRFNAVDDETCLDVTSYHRNFSVLDA